MMPLIKVTLPAGLLDDEQKAAVAERLTVEVMKVETGGHDTPGFRAISALLLDEIPAGAWSVGGRFDAGPSAIVEIRVPEGALDDERRATMAAVSYNVLTAISPALAAVDGVRRIWTHLVEIGDGNWGAGGRIVRLPDVQQIAMSMPEPA
ncbi:hypothetical protein CWO89_22370 [Bradyrhizobium sp. Leo170]|nr:hypothetical protein CWO89_22370 [Bradyrhizobium sp. Leo170]